MADTQNDNSWNQMAEIKNQLVDCIECMNQLNATDPQFKDLAENVRILQEAAKLEQERLDVEDRTNERHESYKRRPKLDPNVVVPAAVAAATMAVGIAFESLGNGLLTSGAAKWIQGVTSAIKR